MPRALHTCHPTRTIDAQHLLDQVPVRPQEFEGGFCDFASLSHIVKKHDKELKGGEEEVMERLRAAMQDLAHDSEGNRHMKVSRNSDVFRKGKLWRSYPLKD